jgi:hypothetical protein
MSIKRYSFTLPRDRKTFETLLTGIKNAEGQIVAIDLEVFFNADDTNFNKLVELSYKTLLTLTTYGKIEKKE